MNSAIRFLCASGLLLAAGASLSAAFFPLTTVEFDLENGQTVFRKHCASCHSMGGNRRIGPPLDRIDLNVRADVPSSSLEEYIVRSIVSPNEYVTPGYRDNMPTSFGERLSRQDLLDVAAFVTAANRRPNYRRILQTPMPPEKNATVTALDVDRLERAKHLYFEKAKCAACHEASFAGPSLLNIGTRSDEELREAILQPSKKILPSFKPSRMLVNGVLTTGRIIKKTDDSVTLVVNRQGNPTVETYLLDDLEPFESGELIETSDVSLMPSFEKFLSPEELQLLIELLRSGPFH